MRIILRSLMMIIIECSRISSNYAHDLCVSSIRKIAVQSGVSAELLTKVAQVESGIGSLRQPWPWTVNVQGHDYYFKSAQGAVSYMKQLQHRGITSFDVGCFQINWRWHRHKVRDVAELIDPDTNTTIAAQYLRELYQRHGSVVQAVAHYHSAQPHRGRAYVGRVLSDIHCKKEP